MLKSFLLKKMLKSQMKNVPAEQQDMVLRAVDKNPELFQMIAAEVKQEMKSGKDQMTATMAVMQRHQSELQEAMKQ